MMRKDPQPEMSFFVVYPQEKDQQRQLPSQGRFARWSSWCKNEDRAKRHANERREDKEKVVRRLQTRL